MFDGAEADSDRKGCCSAAGWRWRLRQALLAAVVIHLGSVEAVRAQALNSSREFQFDIPSQSLAAALREYGKTTGVEVFYDGSLAVGRRSAAVRGMFSQMRGLQVLLRETDYVPRATEIANTVTIVSAPSVAPVRATFDRYQPYFAALQARVSAALCNDDEAAALGEEIRFKFWLDPLGMISNAELLGADGQDSRRSVVALKVKGLRIGKAPPAELPQPVTMIIYPPSAGEAGCPPTSSRHAHN